MKARSCWPVVVTMTTSKPGGFKNVPPPPGSKAGTTYNRFIPREELGDFASWRPDAFGGQGDRRKPAGAEPAAPAAPPEPTAADWQARVAAARQAGYQEGYRDGLVALESFKQTFAQQATAQIGALLDAFDAQFELLDAQLAQAVARTAVQLARQVLRAELEQRPEIVSMVAAEAVNSVMLSARHIAVHVHPLDLPLVAEGAEESLTARGARLHANTSVERGGVLVQSDVGDIDARIAVRWAQAAANLGHEQALDDGTPELADAPEGDA
jgi:flagellar assembly protein FliH